MSDPLKRGSLPDGQFLPEAEWNAETSFASARFSAGDEIFRSIQPGNVRRLVEKFRRLGDQTFQSKPYNNRSSCARKVTGSLSDCRTHRSVSFRKKELRAMRKKTDQLKKSRALDEKWILLTPCLFSPGDFVSSSVSIPQKSVDCRNISRSFPSDGDRDRLVLTSITSLASDEPMVMKLCDQMEFIDVNALDASTNASSPSAIIDEDVVKCDEVYLDSTSKSFEDQTVNNGSAVNDSVNDQPDLPAGFLPGSEASILTSPTSSHELVGRLVGAVDNVDLNRYIENLSDARTISHNRSEAEKTSAVTENLYENVPGCSNYEKIEINSKLWVCRDQTCTSPSTGGASSCGNERSRCDSIFTASNNSVDSFDSDLIEYDIIRRNECLSSLPAQTNNVPSRHKQENIYQNVVPNVNSFPVNSSTHVASAVHAAGNVYWCMSEKTSLRNETRINEAGNKVNAYDFTTKNPVSELLCHSNERLYTDDENIYEECDFLSCGPIPDFAAYRTDGLETVPSAEVWNVSKDCDVSEDNSENLTLSDDVICKDSNSSSIYETISGCNEINEDESNAVEGKQALVFEPVDQLERIKAELVETEKKYIDRLWLINGEFRMGLMSWNEENELLPADAFNQMFLNIDVIYKLHSVFFLPDLEACLNAEVNKHIEDIFLKNADFLKLYAEYSCNFDNAIKTIEMWKSRIPEFKKIIEEIQQKPACHSLSLEHHMLEPIQRIPRYKLLLSKYLENLPKDSPEYEKTEKALVKVTAAAEHCNKFLGSLMKFQKVLDVQQQLWDKIELLTPSRELILSGRMKVTQQLENEEEKHLFLFSDTLLVCKKFPHGITPPYKLTLRLDVGDMQLIDRKKEGTAESFFLIGRQGYLEVIPSSSEEREKWISALQTVLSNFAARELSRRPGKLSGINRQKSISGSQAPIWIKDHFANRCMQCDESFNALRRRHHCRACGIVVCGRCSNKQIPLEFDGFSQSHRVCDKCFSEIQNSVDQNCSEQRVNAVDKNPNEQRNSASTTITQLMRSDGKSSTVPGHRQKSIFFFQTPGDKSQSHGQANGEQKLPV